MHINYRDHNVEMIANATKWGIALLAGFWMNTPAAVHALLGLMILDLATGLVVAWVGKTVSSDIMRAGLAKKLLTLIVLLTCHVAEKAAGVEFHIEAIGGVGYCINEVISIIENAARVGVPVPEQVVNALLAAKKVRGWPKASDNEIKQLDQ